jgi:hypothetical protein
MSSVPDEFWSDVLPFVPDAPQQASSTDGYVKRGPEWVVPTYEPERATVGATQAPSVHWADAAPLHGRTSTIDADALGRSVGRQIAAAIGGRGSSGSGEIVVKVYLDGKQIRSAVAEGYRQGDRELIEQTRRRVQ